MDSDPTYGLQEPHSFNIMCSLDDRDCPGSHFASWISDFAIFSSFPFQSSSEAVRAVPTSYIRLHEGLSYEYSFEVLKIVTCVKTVVTRRRRIKKVLHYARCPRTEGSTGHALQVQSFVNLTRLKSLLLHKTLLKACSTDFRWRKFTLCTVRLLLQQFAVA